MNWIAAPWMVNPDHYQDPAGRGLAYCNVIGFCFSLVQDLMSVRIGESLVHLGLPNPPLRMVFRYVWA